MKRNKKIILPARPSSGGGYLSKESNLEFERLNKTKRKKLIIASILGLGIIIGGISLYRSYALYEEEKEYNVLKGQIPDFGYDVKVAITVDGTKTEKVPDRKANDNTYYKVNVTCNNNTEGEWDYNAWNLKIDEITSDSKCTLAFNGNLSKEEYQNYIDAGIALRRNTYRGKKLELTNEFWNSIKNGTFDDIYVGDYIKSKIKDESEKEITWLVADIDNYLYTGGLEDELTQHHLTIIPAAPLMSASMNDTDTTEGGYTGSKMYKETLNTVFDKYIANDFKDAEGKTHIITYYNLLTNTVDDARINRYGSLDSGFSGASSNWEWVKDRKLDLMSEINVYGTTVWSSSGLDTGIDNRQYAIFQLKPELINSDGTARLKFNYWLKDVVSSTTFADVSTSQNAHNFVATGVVGAFGVRPRFLIG